MPVPARAPSPTGPRDLRSLGAGIAGVFLISWSPILVVLSGATPGTAAFYRVLFGAGLLALYAVVRRDGALPTRRSAVLAAASGLFLALDLQFLHESIARLGPGLATLLANLQVIVLALFGAALFRERPAKRAILAVPLALAGLTLTVKDSWWTVGLDYQAGVLFGLLTAVCYAGFLLLLRTAHSASPGASRSTHLACASLAAVALLGVLESSLGAVPRAPTGTGWGYLVLYAVSSQFLGWILITRALESLPVIRLGLVLLFQPALSLTWDWLLFGRSLSPIESLGVAVALTAILLGNSSRSSVPPTKPSVPHDATLEAGRAWHTMA